MGNRDHCYPLTVADQHTRYLLGIQGMDGDGHGVKGRFERLFREVGLPRAIQTDNGAHERMHQTLKSRIARPPASV